MGPSEGIYSGFCSLPKPELNIHNFTQCQYVHSIISKWQNFYCKIEYFVPLLAPSTFDPMWMEAFHCVSFGSIHNQSNSSILWTMTNTLILFSQTYLFQLLYFLLLSPHLFFKSSYFTQHFPRLRTLYMYLQLILQSICLWPILHKFSEMEEKKLQTLLVYVDWLFISIHGKKLW